MIKDFESKLLKIKSNLLKKKIKIAKTRDSTKSSKIRYC